jgi:hypothetical protein
MWSEVKKDTQNLNTQTDTPVFSDLAHVLTYKQRL